MIAEQLTKSLLQAAIHGKLTQQLPEDGDTHDLLKEIKKEKAQLIREGKIKKEKPLPEITEDEIPFDIPENWCWIRLGEIINLKSGQDMSSDKYSSINSGVPYITGASNFCNGVITINRWTNTPQSIAKKGDLLITCKGTVGEMAFLNEEKAHIARQIMAITVTNFLSDKFLHIFLKWYVSELKSMAKSMIPGISRDMILHSILPLPPLDEQKRIVQRLNELLPEIDKLKIDEFRLDVLQKGFPKRLRASVLQCAVEGKLTEQLPSDGDAHNLLREIQKEKARLFREGKIKKEKPLPEIKEDEVPFDIPENWCWVRLGHIFEIARGGSPRPIQAFLTSNSDGINWIKIGDTDIGGKYINQTKEKIKPTGLRKSRLVNPGDLLLTNSMSFGRPYILNIKGCIHDGWLVLSPRSKVLNKEYFFYLLSSNFVHMAFANTVAGAVVKNLNSDKVRLIYVPLPPINEQKRIVERLEKLLPEIGKLERLIQVQNN